MTNEEFDLFYAWSISSQTKDLMDSRCLIFEDAYKHAMEEIMQMLPDKLNTPDHYLMTIVLSHSEEVVGFAWMFHELTDCRKQNFLCDFMILESYRRKGYATVAMKLIDQYAVESGCVENILYVSDYNIAAQNLYLKCGYQFLRKHGNGYYLKKYLC